MKRLVLALTACALVPGPAVTQEPAPNTQAIRPGDVIRVEIWREPDMSGEFIVDEAGSVVFPRVGEYQVVTETPATLEAKLLADYRQYLRNPSIDVTVLRRVRVIGAVNLPGLKLLDPTVTIRDALAIAGGATGIGDQNKIRIIRNGQEVAVEVSVDTRLGDSIIQSGDEIFVPERSWASRNTGIVATAISSSVALIIAIFIR